MPAGPVEARSKPRSIRVQDELTQRIDRGMLPAGSRLPSEPALAVELGVSRATLREALRALESEGLVISRRGAICVQDRAGLIRLADRLYGIAEAEYRRLIPGSRFGSDKD